MLRASKCVPSGSEEVPKRSVRVSYRSAQSCDAPGGTIDEVRNCAVLRRRDGNGQP